MFRDLSARDGVCSVSLIGRLTPGMVGFLYLVQTADVVWQPAMGCPFCGAFAVVLWPARLDGYERADLLLVDLRKKALSRRQAQKAAA
jgi:hypothetical protein